MPEIQQGNQCLFMMFILFNFMVFLSSLGILGSAVYLFIIVKKSTIFALAFLISSLALLIFSSLAFKLR